jgi:transcriptional regulator with XRE-family HTH domain
MSRYMAKDVQPPANVLSKIADALGVSADYLLNGDTDAKAVASLSHAEVIQQYKEVDQLPADERNTVIKVVAALLRDYRTRQAYAG